MILTLSRVNTKKNYTIGCLYDSSVGRYRKEFLCYTLENGHRDKKVRGKTRIPEGVYEITLRKVGGHHHKYKRRYFFHKGMLWLRKVPNFTNILIHAGNYPKDTDGCILVGSEVRDCWLGNSVVTYCKIYPRIAEKILTESVYIEIIDYASV
jgi:hypothetical protein